MGHRCCSKLKVNKGLWSPEEDEKLLKHITTHGHGSWSSVPKLAGLQRCGKSCRLRWINYLRPDLRRGYFTEEEEQIIIDVHRILGNRWAQIARHLPGRTDNEVKNYWNSCIKKKLMSQGLDPKTHNLMPSHRRPSNKIAGNIPQTYQQQQQQPISLSVFTVNSQIPSDVSMEIRPPVLTLPAPPPPPPPPFLNGNQSLVLQPIIISVPNSEYQNPNLAWNAGGQNSHDSTIFSYISSVDQSGPISSSSSSSENPLGFGLSDENYCFWATNIIPEHIQSPSLAGKPQQEQEQRDNEKIYETQIYKIDEAKVCQDMDCSFESSSFDLEFVDSTLMSGAMCRDFSSISMDDFAWNF